MKIKDLDIWCVEVTEEYMSDVTKRFWFYKTKEECYLNHDSELKYCDDIEVYETKISKVIEYMTVKQLQDIIGLDFE